MATLLSFVLPWKVCYILFNRPLSHLEWHAVKLLLPVRWVRTNEHDADKQGMDLKSSTPVGLVRRRQTSETGGPVGVAMCFCY